MKYEESFQNMKYMKNTMEKPTSYYLSDPPLPDEDLQPTKDSKEEEKNSAKNKADAESSRIAGNQGVNGAKGGMRPGAGPDGAGPMGRNMPGGMPGGPMGMQGQVAQQVRPRFNMCSLRIPYVKQQRRLMF